MNNSFVFGWQLKLPVGINGLNCMITITLKISIKHSIGLRKNASHAMGLRNASHAMVVGLPNRSYNISMLRFY